MRDLLRQLDIIWHISAAPIYGNKADESATVSSVYTKKGRTVISSKQIVTAIHCIQDIARLKEIYLSILVDL